MRNGLIAAGLSIAILLGCARPVAADELIRVLIADNRQKVTIETVRDGRSGRSARTERRIIKGGSVPKTGMCFTSPNGIVRVNGRPYRGSISIRQRQDGKLMIINELGLEDYLKGVVPAEIPHDWEPEVLKAQAVTARSYALYEKGQTGGRPYHIRATVDSQMYLGLSAERERSTRAVNETRGVVILYDGEAIPAFYHSSCGGHTEDAGLLWGLDVPYLKGVDCDCQEISRYGLWEKRFSPSAVVRALQRHGYRMLDIESVGIGEMTPAGRVKSVLFGGKSGRVSVPTETVRAALGYAEVPSGFFEPELLDGEIVFSGRGLGHGVGLCQWGARTLARKGFDFKTILAYYYPGTTVGLPRAAH